MSAAEVLQVQVPEGYENAEDLDVLAMLRLNPELYDVLTEGRAKVAEYFGPAAQVLLRVAFFPEGGQRLYAIVLRPGENSDALLPPLERFDGEWSLPNEVLMWSPLTFTIGSDS